MVRGDSPIRSAADNRGSIGHALVIAVSETQGWGGRDITIVKLMPTEVARRWRAAEFRTILPSCPALR